MQPDERRHRILEFIRMSGGFASLPQLSAELGVSESTIRRDLDVLEESGVARRTHGGVFYAGGGTQLPVFELREPEQWAKKHAIAQAAALMIDDGDTVFLRRRAAPPTNSPDCWWGDHCKLSQIRFRWPTCLQPMPTQT